MHHVRRFPDSLLRRYSTHNPPVTFKGLFPILATPFKKNGEFDDQSFTNTIGFMKKIGVNGVTILGVLGESNRVTDYERDTIISSAIAASQRDGLPLPIVVGTSHSGTKATADLSKRAQDHGASAVMVTPSREPTPNEEKIYEYFEQVAANINIPIVLQDHPASTLVNMSIPLIKKIVQNIPLVKCVKEEAPPTSARTSAIKNGLNIDVLTGLGALYGYFEVEAGCDGFMTGFAFPEILQAIMKAVGEKNNELAFQIYRYYLPLIVYEQQPGVGIRKEILKQRGLINDSTVRHPGAAITPNLNDTLKHILEKYFRDVDITKPLKVKIDY